MIERAARLTAGERAGSGRPATTVTEPVPQGAEVAAPTDATIPGGEPTPGRAGGKSAAEAAGGGRAPDVLAEMARAALDPGSLMNRALGNPAINLLKGGANNPVILRAGWPAAGMVTTARGLAGFYRALIAGEILRPETLQEALRPRVHGPDRVLCLDTSFGLGFMRPSMTFLVPSPSAFGHSGAGGSIGVGDPGRGLAIAYVMNKMANAISGNLRGHRLLQAVYESL